jgi:alanyl aminopeptidase
VPAEETFSGAVDIDLDVREPVAAIWMHGAGLTLKEASLGELQAKPVTAGKHFLGFAFGQFEATDARHAFPCFDEPSFKTPWQLTLHVKREQAAFSNTPVASETEEPGDMKAVRFPETKPLPSYLVALAVRPFETVDAGKAGKKSTPLRIVTPRGKRGQAGYAAEVTGRIVALLEDYFGISYPYEKLDSVAAPLFPGAMENAGLVIYGQTILLSKPEEETIGFKRNHASVAAHELAHMWFGDLVTTAWWNDIWLNEAFATWMAPKIIARLQPEWGTEISTAQSLLGAMGQDNLVSARKIRQPIESDNDIANAFDGITYNKGAAVIRMFESWVGPDKFRQGVEAYLKQHAYGSATAADFLAAVSTAAGPDIAPAFSTFLDQAGVPLVAADLKCGENQPPALELTQKRFLPLGSRGSSQQAWQIPVCVKYGDRMDTRRECAVLAQPSAEVRLAAAQSCPSWLLLNAEETGYYRALYKGGLLERLLADGGKRLSVPEHLGLIGDVQVAMSSGDLPAGQALRLVPLFAGDSVRQIVGSTVSIVAGIDSYLVPDELRPNYIRLIQKYYGARARELGWQPKPGEDDDTRLLRPTLLNLVANVGEDRTLIAEAGKLANRWLDDHKGISPDLVSLVLSTAARYGDRSLYDRFRAELAKTRDEKQRGQLISAISSFRDPEIAQANFDLFLAGELDARESFGLLFGPLGDPKTRQAPFQLVKQNYDRIVAKLPQMVGTDLSAYLPLSATGGPRMLAQALERISLCSARREAQQAEVAAFLRQY